MNYFLAKTDPETYSLEQFAADGRTTWDGVRNPQAVRAIRAMRPGDRVFVYLSGGASAVAALAKVVSEPRDDPRDAKSAVVDLEFTGRLEPPVTLKEIKSEPRFAEFALVRQSRLSTMAVPPEFVDWMRARYPKAKI